LLRTNRSDQSILGHLEIAERPIPRRIDPRLTASAVPRRRTVVLPRGIRIIITSACRIPISIRRRLAANGELIGLVDMGTFVRHGTDRLGERKCRRG
jgi:hypothetical protein